jgi:2',3'-cyclic-nucleotide 2'-phosphodiesterase/3'-nucleotidase/5'-nucleotidase
MQFPTAPRSAPPPLRRPAAGILLLAQAACALAFAPTPGPDPASAPYAFELILLGTTDVHGRLVPHDYYTGRPTGHGLAVLKPLVDSIRDANPGRTFLFDSGDLLQGNPLTFVHARQRPDAPNPVIRAMNLLGYDAAAIGNHEFNYGLAYLDRAIAQARFPFLTANAFRYGTDQPAYRPYVLLTQATPAGDTLRIGVTANTPPGVHLWDRAHVQGVLEFRDIVASLRAAVAAMRDEGADVIVVLSHGGLEGTSYDTVASGLTAENVAARVARDVPGIDVIFMGHTHVEIPDTVIAGVLLTQAGHHARSLAVATLGMERGDDGRWRVASRRGRLLKPPPGRIDRAFVDSLRADHEQTIAYVRTVIGRTAAALPAREGRVRDVPIIRFINEVQRAAAGADLSATAAFDLGAGLPAGDITVADVARLYPYENTLRAVRITGAQLRAYLERSALYYTGWPVPPGGTVTDATVPGYNFDIVSGVEYTMDLRQPAGARITTLMRAGRPVADADVFTLALNSYRQAGGGGYAMLADAPVVYDRQEDIRELLIDAVRRAGVVVADDDGLERWRLLPEAAAARAVEEQLGRDARYIDRPTEAPARPRLRVLATSDFHGRLEPFVPTWAEAGRAAGGAKVLAAHLARERAGFAGSVVLLDGGDVMQGTPVSNLSSGAATIDVFNAIGYTAGAIGNHEFDWGVDVLRERKAQAAFPWLSANLVVAGTDTLPSWARDTAIVQVGGVRVGVVGLLTEEAPRLIAPARFAGLGVSSGTAALDRYVPALRAAGVDFVIAVAHAGAVCTLETEDCRGEALDWLRAARHRPDLFVGGHTHVVARTAVDGTVMLGPGAYGLRYGVVDLERIAPDSVDVWIRGVPVTWVDAVEPDTAIARIVEGWARELRPLTERVIATLAHDLPRSGREYALGRLIADAQRRAAGADLAIINNGGIRADLRAGPVTWGDAYRVHPFENEILRLRVRGATVRAAVEHALTGGRAAAHVAGMTVAWDPRRPGGSRVLAITLDDGRPLDDAAQYSLAVSDFVADGGDGYTMLVGAPRERTGLVDFQVLIDELTRRSQPVVAPAGSRFRAVDAVSNGNTIPPEPRS